MRPQLVLDVGGVLLTNLTNFWGRLAVMAGLPYADVRAVYKAEMRAALWTGAAEERRFWEWAAARLPSVDPNAARQALLDSMRPLPALDMLPAWNALADVHILSNHRAEWLRPALSAHLPRLASLTISSEAGSAKPDPAIYEAARAKLAPGAPVLFVDDKAANLQAASALGWQTLLADEHDSRWTAEVEPLLRKLGGRSV